MRNSIRSENSLALDSLFQQIRIDCSLLKVCLIIALSVLRTFFEIQTLFMLLRRG